MMDAGTSIKKKKMHLRPSCAISNVSIIKIMLLTAFRQYEASPLKQEQLLLVYLKLFRKQNKSGQMESKP